MILYTNFNDQNNIFHILTFGIIWLEKTKLWYDYTLGENCNFPWIIINYNIL